MLQPQGQNNFGNLYRAYIRIRGPTGLSRRIRMVWIVRLEEDVANGCTGHLLAILDSLPEERLLKVRDFAEFLQQK